MSGRYLWSVATVAQSCVPDFKHRLHVSRKLPANEGLAMKKWWSIETKKNAGASDRVTKTTAMLHDHRGECFATDEVFFM